MIDLCGLWKDHELLVQLHGAAITNGRFSKGDDMAVLNATVRMIKGNPKALGTYSLLESVMPKRGVLIKLIDSVAIDDDGMFAIVGVVMLDKPESYEGMPRVDWPEVPWSDTKRAWRHGETASNEVIV